MQNPIASPPLSTQWDYLSDLLPKRVDKFKKELRKTKKDLSAEPVHDLRVATRRLMAILLSIQLLQNNPAIKKTIKSLKKFLKPLGKYRDLLLQSGLLEKEKMIKKHALYLYHTHVQNQLEKEKQQVNKVLCDFDHAASGMNPVRHNHGKSSTSGNTGMSNRVNAFLFPDAFDYESGLRITVDWHLQIHQAMEEILKLRKNVFEKLDMDDFHKMRIRVKRLRYQLEILVGFMPRIRKKHLDTLANLQTLMGDIHDLDVLALDLLEFSRSLYPWDSGYLSLAEYIQKLSKKRNNKFQQFHKEFLQFQKLFHP